MADVPLQIVSDNSASERRITPAWTVSQLKAKLEPITGVPPSAQRLSLRIQGRDQPVPVEAADEDATRLTNFPLEPYAELLVSLSPIHQKLVEIIYCPICTLVAFVFPPRGVRFFSRC